MRRLRPLLFLLIFPLFSMGQSDLRDTTFTQSGSHFQLSLTQGDKHTFQIIKDNADTISSMIKGEIEIIDFNKDGFQDLFITNIGNIPTHELFLFDNNAVTFRKVKNLDKYSEPKMIAGTRDLYYSYRRAGCADMNWTSHLIRIANFETTALGLINGLGCNSREEERLIEIWVLKSGNQSTLKETLSIETLSEFENGKWGFIKAFWTEHYKDFE